MDRIFRVVPEKCVACGKCELACAFAHGQDGVPGVSRIRIYRRGPEAGVPIICLQCDSAACAAACSVGAIKWNVETGALEVDRDKCVGCMMCVAACPFGNIYMEPGLDKAAKCDLCGGKPQCVAFCPTGAIAYVPTEAGVKYPCESAV
ncbi:MAG TPA: 4Fe-4S dicluster domain-containing protein [Myxococcota bacterium]|nr:4Fe-4S dicluster domain-containing protein [Myxococcota bacterium]HOA13609.1 4Fe-4S dicluster domain-containing protein [Myxococcota bacterium]HOC99245.1 4Fe-4S dicluster domain-containing protein [Myxococcota bacterium]HOH76957.1 4Fe-4S dicluster domain-containing protein [Myxococcota bacterium]HPV04761.1 4Fe-4S dicluster domain-containing protein [Myxococcota bacterium]